MTWTHAVVRVGSHDVLLALEVLPEEQRAPMAASIAWYAVLSATEDESARRDAWQAFMSTIMSPHVEFSVAHDHPEQLGESWWLEAVRSALETFVRVNTLDALVSEQLPSALHLARTQQAAS